MDDSTEQQGIDNDNGASIPILLISNGPEPPAVIARFGEFDSLIQTALTKLGLWEEKQNKVNPDSAGGDVHQDGSLSSPLFKFTFVCSYKGELNDLPKDVETSYAAVLLSGSFHDVTETTLPWKSTLSEWLLSIRHKVPILGICFGHQLLTQAFGGNVDFMASNGRSIGSVPLQLVSDAANKANASFKPLDILRGLPSTFLVSDTHRQAVLRLPEGAISLGCSKLDANHIVAYDALTVGCQFHPEYPPGILTELYREGKDITTEDADAFDAGTADTPESRHILGNFMSLAVERWKCSI